MTSVIFFAPLIFPPTSLPFSSLVVFVPRVGVLAPRRPLSWVVIGSSPGGQSRWGGRVPSKRLMGLSGHAGTLPHPPSRSAHTISDMPLYNAHAPSFSPLSWPFQNPFQHTVPFLSHSRHTCHPSTSHIHCLSPSGLVTVVVVRRATRVL